MKSRHLVLAVAVILVAAGFASAVLAQPAPGERPLPAPAEQLRSPQLGDLDTLRRLGRVRVLVAHSASGFFYDGGQPRGFDAELMKGYGEYLNGWRDSFELPIQIAFVPVPFERLIPDLLAGRGDVVAAGVTVTRSRAAQVQFTAPYLGGVDEIVVAHRSVAKEISSVDDLAGRTLFVVRGSSHAEHLRARDVEMRKRGLAGLTVVEMGPALAIDDLMEMLNAGVLPLIVADSHEAMRWGQVLPDLVPLREVVVSEGRNLALAVRPDSPQLKASLDSYLKGSRKGTLTGNILFKRYYERTNWIADTDDAKLAGLEKLFRRYAARYDFDWLAIAAISYQESRFDQTKRSRMGALGVMQIKPSTARDPNIGIAQVGQLENNVHAGVKYLAFLRDRYFSEPEFDGDRFYFTVAAYNMGPARVQRLRQSAREMGLDPNRWFDNVESATQKQVGRGPARYVSNVAKYYAAYELSFRTLEQRRTQRQAFEASAETAGGDGG